MPRAHPHGEREAGVRDADVDSQGAILAARQDAAQRHAAHPEAELQIQAAAVVDGLGRARPEAAALPGLDEQLPDRELEARAGGDRDHQVPHPLRQAAGLRRSGRRRQEGEDGAFATQINYYLVAWL